MLALFFLAFGKPVSVLALLHPLRIEAVGLPVRLLALIRNPLLAALLRQRGIPLGVAEILLLPGIGVVRQARAAAIRCRTHRGGGRCFAIRIHSILPLLFSDPFLLALVGQTVLLTALLGPLLGQFILLALFGDAIRIVRPDRGE